MLTACHAKVLGVGVNPCAVVVQIVQGRSVKFTREEGAWRRWLHASILAGEHTETQTVLAMLLLMSSYVMGLPRPHVFFQPLTQSSPKQELKRTTSLDNVISPQAAILRISVVIRAVGFEDILGCEGLPTVREC